MIVLDALFPRRCPFCRRAYSGGFCRECLPSLPFAREQLPSVFAPFVYVEPVNLALRDYKFRKIFSYARPFAEYIAPLVRGEFDVVIAVPSFRYQTEHAVVLAKALSRRLGLPFSAELRKIRKTEKQHNLSERQRAVNLAGAFKVKNPAKIRGKRVLLVDDIFTTGATFAECRRTLLEAGAHDVKLACVAKTEKR